ncbi:unnamed protein product [Meloidogyne enterolobii]|uniref:Uncharacterized protein n=1 Tax=Meloidogyne enterolobii TaxID=390850 RepID=A0ACB0YT56_MELEN
MIIKFVLFFINSKSSPRNKPFTLTLYKFPFILLPSTQETHPPTFSLFFVSAFFLCLFKFFTPRTFFSLHGKTI